MAVRNARQRNNYEYGKACEQLQRQFVLDVWIDLRAVEACDEANWHKVYATATERFQKAFKRKLPFGLEDWQAEFALRQLQVLPKNIREVAKLLNLLTAHVRETTSELSFMKGGKSRPGREPRSDEMWAFFLWLYGQWNDWSGAGKGDMSQLFKHGQKEHENNWPDSLDDLRYAIKKACEFLKNDNRKSIQSSPNRPVGELIRKSAKKRSGERNR